MAEKNRRSQATCNDNKQSAQQQSSFKPNYHITTRSFREMNLRDELLRGISFGSSKQPTVFMQRAIVPCLTGRNVIIQALPGDCKGKAATYAITILQKIDCNEMRNIQALILTPTNEKAFLMWMGAMTIGHVTDDLFGACTADDTCAGMNNAKLVTGYHLVTGTPKSVHAMISLPAFRLKGDLKLLIVDEADEMMSRRGGFKDSIYNIFNTLAPDVQVILLTGSMTPEVLDITKNFVRDPLRIVIEKNSGSDDGEVSMQELLTNLERDGGKHARDVIEGMFKSTVEAGEAEKKQHAKQQK